MAGIGFELKKLFKDNRLISIFQVYGYSALLSSGTWMISIFSILFIGLIKTYQNKNVAEIIQFQVSITYLLALSLIFSSFFQLSFSRYIADMIFHKKQERILPGFVGVIFIIFSLGFIFILGFSFLFLRHTSPFFIILFCGSFLSLSGMWIANTLLLGIKKYKLIFSAYLFSYSSIILLAFSAGNYKLEGLMFSFFFGNSVLFFWLSAIVVKNYKSQDFIDFGFLSDKEYSLMPCLIFGSFFYNMGTWIDKAFFWFSENTGYRVLSKLNASIVYDLPLFLAYLSIIPGMAIFFYRLEADFAEKYELFYKNVREGGTLKEIKDYKEEMTDTVRIMIREVIVVQGIFDLLIYFYSPAVFEMLNMPKLYLPLFHIDLISVQLQLGLMSMLSVLYYMDKRREAMWISLFFMISNSIFTWITIKHLGPFFFGYGFGFSVFSSFIISLYVLRKTFRNLEYETFMLR
ncbi:MAG: exopolysaccharide Pel transporter PelG [Elusimicrobia bacterium]|nr:exopolysaccharide Pel transporter PelG [Elusimicrobiota bacterium]